MTENLTKLFEEIFNSQENRFLCLKEAYNKEEIYYSNKTIIDDLSYCLRENDFSLFREKYNSLIEIVDSGFSASFDTRTGLITIHIGKKEKEEIINNYDIFRYSRMLNGLLVHEDTHRQQFSKFKDFNKNYINSNRLKEYLCQNIEIDAYARQHGKMLEDLYPEKSFNEIFDLYLNNNLIDKDLQNDMNVFKNPIFKGKVRDRYFRKLFDFF